VPQCRQGTIGRAEAMFGGGAAFGFWGLTDSSCPDARSRFQSQMPSMITNKTTKNFMVMA